MSKWGMIAKNCTFDPWNIFQVVIRESFRLKVNDCLWFVSFTCHWSALAKCYSTYKKVIFIELYSISIHCKVQRLICQVAERQRPGFIFLQKCSNKHNCHCCRVGRPVRDHVHFATLVIGLHVAWGSQMGPLLYIFPVSSDEDHRGTGHPKLGEKVGKNIYAS